MTDINFAEDGEDDASASQTPDKLMLITNEALKLARIDTEIARLTLQLESVGKDRELIVSRTLPDLMAECQMTDFGLEGGARVVINDFVNLSIPTEAACEKAHGDERQALLKRRRDCFDWMRANNEDDIIKSEVAVVFPKGKDNMRSVVVEAVCAVNKEHDLNLSIEETSGVHAATLKSWANELKKEGRIWELPKEAFNVFVGKRASILYPKQKKAR